MAERNKLPTPINTADPVPDFALPKKLYEPKEVKTPTGLLRLRCVKGLDEIHHIESLWQQAATRGEGFGLDEFTEEGYFNRKFFRQANILVAENTQGEIVGVSVFGPSSLSRMENPLLSVCYVTVEINHRKERVGSSLLEYSMDLLKKDGFKGVLSDTYVTNHQMICLLRMMDYSFVGSLPMCAYVAHHGPTESLLVYKEL